MKKWMSLLFAAALLWYVLGLCQDLHQVQSATVRLHVVAASDSREDQDRKLQVRDAVLTYLEPVLAQAAGRQEALQLLEAELPALKAVAEQVLKDTGEQVTVTLEPEAFSRRDYETFSLPSGVYEALRIRIGEAEGKNWWCVVFPSFCLGAAGEAFRDTAAGAGFDDTLTDTLTGEYELRFFFLDCLGALENFFFGA